MHGDRAIEKLLDDYPFTSVVDVGAGGKLEQSRAFAAAGKQVTAVDPYKSGIDIPPEIRFVHQPVEQFASSGEQFDLVWCCHCLEHQYNPIAFLQQLRPLTPEGGLLAITVPPLKHEIVTGHVTLWNGGLLLYNLVLAGYDCHDAALRKYGYNITAIIRRRDITPPSVHIADLAPYLPDGYNYQGFNGDIEQLNW